MIVMSFFLVSCGQSGSLYLPNQPANQNTLPPPQDVNQTTILGTE